MTSRVSHTSVDCRDAHALSVFWGRVLGYAGDPEEGARVMAPLPETTNRSAFIV